MKTKKPKVKETEVAEIIIAWLRELHWVIYQEVQYSRQGGIADIVAVRDGKIWVIETKTAYTMDVLQQASRWHAHYRSVGVPKAEETHSRDYRVAEHYYRVGVLEVDHYRKSVEEVINPPVITNHHKWAKDMIADLTDLHKSYSKAGSQGSQHLTPYKMTMMEVRQFIEKHPGCGIKEIYESLGDMHYSNRSSFKGSVTKCLSSFEQVWCRIDSSGKSFRFYVKEDAPPIWTPTIEHFVRRPVQPLPENSPLTKV